MWPLIKLWLASPVFPDDEPKTRRANLLNSTLINLLTLLPIIFIGNLLVGRTPFLVFGAIVLAISSVFILRAWMRRGGVRASSVVLIALGIVLITAAVASLGTIRTPSAALYLLVVIIGGLLFSFRGLLTTTAICSILVGGLILAEKAGWLPRPDYSVTITQWIAYAAIFGWTGNLVLSALRAGRESLARADREIIERKKAEEALQESEEKYRLLYENSLDALMLTAPDGRILSANPAACKIFERTEKEICQAGRISIIDTSDPRLSAGVRERDSTGTFMGELTGLRSDGTKFPVEVTSAIFKDRDGNLRTSMIIRDITERKKAEATLRESEERFKALFETAKDSIFIKDITGKYIKANPAMGKMLGIPVSHIIGSTDRDLITKHKFDRIQMEDARVLNGETIEVEHDFIIDGEKVFFETIKFPLRDKEGTIIGLCGIARDITERNQTGAKILRINRALRIISACNRGLTRATNEIDWLNELCRILVEEAGFRMAWIGYAEQDERRRVRPVAYAGFEEGYLGTVDITWADTERGRGPTGTAIRTGEPVIARNIPIDPAFEPWRRAAIQRGYTSSIALPLNVEGTRLGALNVYAAEADAFDAEEVELLSQLAWDLSYGIISLRSHQEREKAQKALHESEAKFKSIYAQSPVGIELYNSDGKLIDANPACLAIFGVSDLKSVLGFDLFHDPNIPEDSKIKLLHGEPVKYETLFDFELVKKMKLYETAKTGTCYLDCLITPIISEKGQINGYLVHVRDITRRKQAEVSREETEAHLRAVLNNAPITIFAMDDRGAFTLSEGKGLEHVGLKPGENVGVSAVDLYGSIPFVEPTGKVTTGKEVIRRALSGETVNAVDELRGVYFDNFISPIRDLYGKVVGVVGVATDITERKHFEDALRESEKKFSIAFHNSPNLIAITTYPDGKIIDINDTWAHALSIGHEESLGKTAAELDLWSNAADCDRCYAELKENGRIRNAEVTLKTKSKSIVCLCTAEFIEFGSRRHVLWEFRDISARKRAEAELRRSREELRALSAKMEIAREEERARIAREIHDELGQRLTVLIMDLSVIAKKIPNDLKPLKEKTNLMVEEVDSLIKTVRRISTEMRPSILDDLGLVPAIEWLCKDFLGQHRIRFRLDLKTKAIDIGRNRNIGVFRIVQEALTNVVRHAKASLIEIRLKENPDNYILNIRDNGRGITKTEIISPNSFGLGVMRERARLLGGEIKISGTPGRGTVLVLKIPKAGAT